ncbi:UDP-N-acetylmuramoyl-L-alanyl-D-glutamate--2,6-diaminopimelate ligase [Bacillus litorisediminis]|uniref:UDP-N-acetylmuramoyl-L-alanyl-D-glutamate--2, 6-diaminopimelate ligase n=1 Tax=Bacillus litorisediminis TaxID=2922713 RepID=UPI001FB00301|nr:UDP-N-acetylmuramoyl-L-alanyl-D-glutamate--2,6-diaminopimelate ligase [Bacillus litorisediminis]
MKLQQLIEHLHIPNLQELPNIEIKSIEQNHQLVQEGSLFICIKGLRFDGHDFANQVVENGAKAILAERPLDVKVPVIVVKDTKRAMAVIADAFYQHPSSELQLIGITGTNGKTSTSHYVESIMKYCGKKTGLIGTMYRKVGETILPTQNTTPDSLSLQQTFYTMKNEEVEVCAMEVSSHALKEGRVYGVDFDIAVFTNLTQDHLDYHGTMEEYRFTKGLLFAQLGNKYDVKRPKYALLNSDEAATEYYKTVTPAFIYTYGIEHEADFMAKDITTNHNGTQFLFASPYGEKQVQIPLVGLFSVYNVLAAASSCLLAGAPFAKVCEAIEKLEGVPGRFELVSGPQDFTIIVDYAHTPDSLENVLETIQQFKQREVWVVVGCGGDRDRTKRPIMAKIACELSEHAIFTSDNPRSEDPAAIIDDMVEGVKDYTNYQVIIDREEAINYAVRHAKKDDVILIAGKGHETYQIIGEAVNDFDDREVARKAVETI